MAENDYLDVLAHHGIKGQKWDIRNGPPYPLSLSRHSAAERAAMKKKKAKTKYEIAKMKRQATEEKIKAKEEKQKAKQARKNSNVNTYHKPEGASLKDDFERGENPYGNARNLYSSRNELTNAELAAFIKRKDNEAKVAAMAKAEKDASHKFIKWMLNTAGAGVKEAATNELKEASKNATKKFIAYVVEELKEEKK